jgi:hypothetical protein
MKKIKFNIPRTKLVLSRDNNFMKATNMGEIMKASFNYILKNYENHEMLSVD